MSQEDKINIEIAESVGIDRIDVSYPRVCTYLSQESAVTANYNSTANKSLTISSAAYRSPKPPNKPH